MSGLFDLGQRLKDIVMLGILEEIAVGEGRMPIFDSDLNA